MAVSDLEGRSACIHLKKPERLGAPANLWLEFERLFDVTLVAGSWAGTHLAMAACA